MKISAAGFNWLAEHRLLDELQTMKGRERAYVVTRGVTTVEQRAARVRALIANSKPDRDRIAALFLSAYHEPL